MKSIALVLFLASSGFAQDLANKAAAPSDADQKASSAIIADVYKADYEQAKTSPQKIKLAKKLLAEGIATKDDPTNRYVLFRIARDIASQEGDLETALAAIRHTDTDFDIDRFKMQVDSAQTAVKIQKSATVQQAYVKLLAPLIDEACLADRYDQAKLLAALAVSCVTEARDLDQTKRMVAKLKETEEIALEFQQVKEAKRTLETQPTDPAANFAVGKFLCLMKGERNRGVTMLVLGNNEEYKSLALLELNEKPDPLKVGDAWWKIAETLSPIPKSRAQAHAAAWYQKALPQLTGLTKSRVEKSIREAPQVDLAAGTGWTTSSPEKIAPATRSAGPAGDERLVADDSRKKWLNVSYDSTIIHVRDKQWSEVDNKTKVQRFALVETGRTAAYVELFCEKRKETWRLSADRMQRKSDKGLEWLANGRWEDSPSIKPGR